MALTRKFLAAMGIEADKIDEIISAHSETVDGLKNEISNWKNKAADYDELKAENEKLKAAGDGDKPYKEKYEELEKEFNDFKAEQTAKETRAAKEVALRGLLKEIGIAEKRVDSVVKITDIDSIKLNKDGAISDSEGLKKSLTEEWADFIVTAGTNGAKTSTPPSSTGKAGAMSRDEIMKIKDTAERQKAIADNIELFQ